MTSSGKQVNVAQYTVPSERAPCFRAMVAIFCAMAVVVSTGAARAGVNVWTSNGPYGILSVSALALDPHDPGTLYAGTDSGGVFRSTDGGGSWGAITTGLSDYLIWGDAPAMRVAALAIDPTTPSTLYAGTGGGVFKSTNGGTSWRVASSPMRDPAGYPLSIQALAIDPITPSTLYAATWGNGRFYPGSVGAGVFKSTNGGTSWSAVNTGLTDPNGDALYVFTLAVDPHTPSTLYAGSGGSGVFQSTDSGGSWTAINTGLGYQYLAVAALAIDPATPSTLYAGTGGGVFRSTNGGGSWSAVNTGLSRLGVAALAIDPATPSTLFAGTYSGGVFQSSDSGDSWIEVDSGLNGTALYVSALAIDPSATSTLYRGSRYSGVLKSTDRGGQWSAVNTGLSRFAFNVHKVAIDPTTPSTLYAGTDVAGVFRSTDRGGTWIEVNAGLTALDVPTLAIDPHAPSTLYAGTGGGVFQSTTGGDSWHWVSSPMTNPDGTSVPIQALAIDPHTSSTLYAVTGYGGIFQNGNGFFQSTDSGGSWNSMTPGPVDPEHDRIVGVSGLAIDPATPTTLYAGTAWYRVDEDGSIFFYWSVFTSTDSGRSWRNTGLNAGFFFDDGTIVIDPTTPSTLYAGTTSSSLARSTDSGSSWTAVNRPKAYVGALAIDPTTPGTLYAGTQDAGVFQSMNGGASWGAFNTGLTNLGVSALAIGPHPPSRLYAATDAGVFDIEQVNACVGDCNDDRTVDVSELITLVNIALGNAEMSACRAGDANGDNRITVDELIQAVNRALSGCEREAEFHAYYSEARA